MNFLKKKSDEVHEMLNHQELERIKKVVLQASDKHHTFTIKYGDSAKDCVQALSSAYDELNNRYRQSQQDIVDAQQARLTAQEEVRRRDGLIVRQKQEHATYISSLERAYREEIERLKTRQEQEHQESQAIINDLKSNLFGKKEQVTGLADRDLSTRFKTLSKNIEQFSRLEWDPSRKTHWPYSEQELNRLNPSNTRRLKQQIVQNCIWIKLHDSVFRTPFRIIGEYGRTFDSSIYEAGSREFDELEPSKATDYNNKRYMNAEVFLNALRTSSSSSAGNIVTLQSYDHARLAAVTFVRSALDNITAVDIRDEDRIDQIWKAAVEFWLEACCQRYRLFVVIPASAVDILGSGPKSVPLQLITKPELQRFGNVTGGDLHQGEVLVGWKSEIETYYT